MSAAGRTATRGRRTQGNLLFKRTGGLKPSSRIDLTVTSSVHREYLFSPYVVKSISTLLPKSDVASSGLETFSHMVNLGDRTVQPICAVDALLGADLYQDMLLGERPHTGKLPRADVARRIVVRHVSRERFLDHQTPKIKKTNCVCFVASSLEGFDMAQVLGDGRPSSYLRYFETTNAQGEDLREALQRHYGGW
jgi:hypothetical protein